MKKWQKFLIALGILYAVICLGCYAWLVRFHQANVRHALIAALFWLSPIALVLVLIIGISGALRSRTLAVRWKVLVASLIAVIGLEGWLITLLGQFTKDTVTGLPSYQFIDNGSYITVRGTWASDAKLDYPAQTTKIECWQSSNGCVEMMAFVADGPLTLETQHWTVREWNQNEVTFEPLPAHCTRTTLHIDRVGKTVTSERTTIEPRPPGCEGFGGSFVFHLANGPMLPIKKH